MSMYTDELAEQPQELTVKDYTKEAVAGSAIINDILFKAIRLYTTCTPYVVRSPCFSSVAVNESATNLAICLNELDFLKEQCVSALKPHSTTVVYDLLQSGMLPEELLPLNGFTF
ncbi:hypothetical protein HELRODRAFT_183246 [Helobdella robusta]|uniref:Uncharacterized protein n=1 Tax=Helobdella robusta TaxID=6412 RepID=T1FJD1_HELRO|nr:hypothetical protein HELRODRAFT_183246 [Helobdella robusta]ESO11366.1 hypothetical protein HELRODRAFT_183246 [Helobdella robusta]